MLRVKNKVTKLQEKYKFLISVDSGVYVSYDGLSMHTAPFTCLTGCYIPTNCSLSVNEELAAQARKSTQSGYFTVHLNIRVKRVYVLIMWTNGGYLLQYLQGMAIAVCTGVTSRLICV